jgi:hypothetical protein
VYFNSASFNGYQFLTDSAIDAGYTSRAFKPDATLIEYGLASIVDQDTMSMLVSAENTVLRILINDVPSRSVVKNMLLARQAVNYGDEIQWSSPEKQWLFELLIDGVEIHPKEWSIDLPVDRQQLRSYISQLPNAPPGAFSPDSDDISIYRATIVPSELLGNEMASIDSTAQFKLDDAPKNTLNSLASICQNAGFVGTSHSIGSLDLLFEDEDVNTRMNTDGEVIGTRNELAVQEALVFLLCASTGVKSKIIQKQLISYTKSLDTPLMNEPRTENQTLVGSHIVSQSGISQNLVDTDELTGSKSLHVSSNSTLSPISNSLPVTTQLIFDVQQSQLLSQLRDTTRTLQSLKESSNRIMIRLLDESTSTGIEGSISQSLQLDLASRLDDHVRDVWQHDLCPKPGVNDIPYEVELERMAEEWGEWYDDDYVWTPGESSKVTTSNSFAASRVDTTDSDLERETLEEFYERVDREWGEWDD